MSEITIDKRKETAYHEAGHVVAAFVLGVAYFESVDTFEGGGGKVVAKFWPFRGSEEEAMLKAARTDTILNSASGFSQYRYLELLGVPWEDAYARAFERGSALDVLSTTNILMATGLDDHWRDRTLAEARELVTTYWEYVEKIAAKLLEKSHLTHHEITPLLVPLLPVWRAARDSS
jgi:hypothetical protein